MTEMTDAEVREALESVGKVYPAWYQYYGDPDTFPPEGLSEDVYRSAAKTLRNKVMILLRLLAESQQALGEISGCPPHKDAHCSQLPWGEYTTRISTCEGCQHLIEIARAAKKGGK